MKKPYLPLMMGDWTQGTRAMRAEVKGVYIGLLIEQYDKGFIPADLSILALIEPEVGKVWDTLRDKFQEFEPGKLRNQKLEEVRAFWNKQRKNGKQGGRPIVKNPNLIPKTNPNHNHHNDLDLDTDLDSIIEIGEKSEFSISIKAKYAHERPRRVYNLSEYFDGRGQLTEIKAAGWADKFTKFMQENPAKVFDDDEHLYNSLKKFNPDQLKENGRPVSFKL